jgi:tRNA U38,U39,U40 pseudouridine synthase TruA
MKTKYAIRLAYDGTDFCGWQTQNSIGDKANPKPSIEETLVAAALDLSGEAVTVTGGRRTDAGVHASGGSAVKSTVREVFEVEVTRDRPTCHGAFASEAQIVWRFRIRGSGFLKQMVRRIAGTLKQIGEGRRPVDDLATLLNGGESGGVGATAPAGGLSLERVWYAEPFGLAEDQDPGQS